MLIVTVSEYMIPLPKSTPTTYVLLSSAMSPNDFFKRPVFRKRDKNQKSIVKALRKVGASVADLADVGNGIPDLLVGYRGQLWLMEIKNPKTAYGRSGLNKEQLAFEASWAGGP